MLESYLLEYLTKHLSTIIFFSVKLELFSLCCSPDKFPVSLIKFSDVERNEQQESAEAIAHCRIKFTTSEICTSGAW